MLRSGGVGLDIPSRWQTQCAGHQTRCNSSNNRRNSTAPSSRIASPHASLPLKVFDLRTPMLACWTPSSKLSKPASLRQSSLISSPSNSHRNTMAGLRRRHLGRPTSSRCTSPRRRRFSSSVHLNQGLARQTGHKASESTSLRLLRGLRPRPPRLSNFSRWRDMVG